MFLLTYPTTKLSLYLSPLPKLVPKTPFHQYKNNMVFFISSSEMLKLICLVCYFTSFGLSDAGQEQVQLLNLVTNPMELQTMSHIEVPIAVSVGEQHITQLSSSVLIAESWLRTHVLTHYPATKITNIVVGNRVICNNDHDEKWGLVLPCVENIYHSLVRWGLEKHIKVSPIFSSQCLHPFSYRFREDLDQRVIKPLLEFLQRSNSSYCVNAPPYYSPLVAAYQESVKKLGLFNLSEINVVVEQERQQFKSRKLYVDPFPARPTQLPEPANTIGFSVPSHVAKNPLPPLVQTAPPPTSLSYGPETPPYVLPSNPPHYITPSTPPPYALPSNPPPPPDVSMYPPCYPPPTPPISPTPARGGHKGLWCVAKPSVPEENLQQAVDYACGVGGADCEEIQPHGSCFYPDTMVAHASYAFNSFWQRNKNNGGTCDFGGTAMIINADPSFMQCRFVFS